MDTYCFRDIENTCIGNISVSCQHSKNNRCMTSLSVPATGCHGSKLLGLK